jgi:peptide/nickel transport system permease protein
MSDLHNAPISTVPPAEPATGTRVEREFTVKERSQARMVVTRFLRHRLAVASLVMLIVIVLFAFVGPYLWHFKYNAYTSDNAVGPSLLHPFGTDRVGYDQMARVMRGTQQSIKVALIVMVMSIGIGAPWGAIAGLLGGKIDTVMMRFCDVLLTLPLIAVAAALGVGHGTVVLIGLILGGLGWAVDARLVRGVVLSLREQEFIEAARALGAGSIRIVFKHLLPNAAGTIIVQATLDIAAAILAETALSFLGFGVQAPDTSLGLLANRARDAVNDQPWLFYFPGLMIILIALTINFIGDGLRDAFDPRQTRLRR